MQISDIVKRNDGISWNFSENLKIIVKLVIFVFIFLSQAVMVPKHLNVTTFT